MKHDELISALNWGITTTGNQLATHKEDALLYRKALLAVVELHIPKYWENLWDSSKNGFDCSICFTYGSLETPSDEVAYPCPTIRAIEKVLL